MRAAKAKSSLYKFMRILARAVTAGGMYMHVKKIFYVSR